MAVTTTAKTDIINASIKGIDPSWRANATVYIALFTADPTVSGSFSNEATYIGYARVAMAKATDFTTVGDTSSNTSLVQFPQATGGSSLCTHFGICTAVTGGTMLFFAPLGEAVSVVSPIQPQFKTGTLQNKVL